VVTLVRTLLFADGAALVCLLKNRRRVHATRHPRPFAARSHRSTTAWACYSISCYVCGVRAELARTEDLFVAGPGAEASAAARRLLRRPPYQREGSWCCTRSRHRRPRNACSGLPSVASTATKNIAVTTTPIGSRSYRRSGPGMPQGFAPRDAAPSCCRTSDRPSQGDHPFGRKLPQGRGGDASTRFHCWRQTSASSYAVRSTSLG
jgi:hypothetical protein